MLSVPIATTGVPTAFTAKASNAVGMAALGKAV